MNMPVVSTDDSLRLLLVVNPASFHVGGHLVEAATAMGVQYEMADTQKAVGGKFWRRVSWRLNDKRGGRQKQFCRDVIEQVERFRPTWLLATGNCPLNALTLRRIADSGVKLANFLTDDPFNPRFSSSWFTKALGEYNRLFTPRRSNLDDLRNVSPAELSYLPFAFNPQQHYPSSIDDKEFSGRMLFVGGADGDRIPILQAAAEAGIPIAIYGGYWGRCAGLREFHYGQGSNEQLRHATASADVSLILVRRANRDGHVMRSFEAAACGGCLLVEETTEHRELFGSDRDSVVYFNSVKSMIDQARLLLRAKAERSRLREAVYRRIVGCGGNTYENRLRAMVT
jgi:spore maturation protein CgeB